MKYPLFHLGSQFFFPVTFPRILLTRSLPRNSPLGRSSARSTSLRLSQRSEDGGWTIESLGPWPAHPRAPRSPGSNAYATGLVAFILQRAGVPASNPALDRALGWLRSHQDPKAGFWEAPSMNKQYAPGSRPLHFMRDAATAFVTLALMEAR